MPFHAAPQAGSGAAAIAPAPPEPRAPAASKPAPLGRTLAAHRPLDPSPVRWFTAVLDKPRNGGCRRRLSRYLESLRERRVEPQLTPLGLRRRRRPQPPPFLFGERLGPWTWIVMARLARSGFLMQRSPRKRLAAVVRTLTDAETRLSAARRFPKGYALGFAAAGVPPLLSRPKPPPRSSSSPPPEGRRFPAGP
jgi:hypothetical protein